MKKNIALLACGNIAAAAGIFICYSINNKSTQKTQADNTMYEVSVEKAGPQTASSETLMIGDVKEDRRKKRISAGYFLPSPGERNAMTDFVDGMVIESMKRRIPVMASFSKLLDEEGNIEKDEKNRQVKLFKDIMTEYLHQVYKIQRGVEDGDTLSIQQDMKSKLAAELSLSGSRLDRLSEIERNTKSNRQLAVFEKLLIRDEDKLDKEQRQKLQGVLSAQQTTVFDNPLTTNEAYDRSDRVMNDVSRTLNADQSAHFKYFQEYHWHSYDFQEMNDMPMF